MNLNPTGTYLAIFLGKKPTPNGRPGMLCPNREKEYETLFVSSGIELTIGQEGLPDAIPVEACYLGWQESLRILAGWLSQELHNRRSTLYDNYSAYSGDTCLHHFQAAE